MKKIEESIRFLEQVLSNGEKYKEEYIERMKNFERNRK